MCVFLVKIVNHSYINVMRIIRKTLISCIKLDHALYSINYSIHNWTPSDTIALYTCISCLSLPHLLREVAGVSCHSLSNPAAVLLGMRANILLH